MRKCLKAPCLEKATSFYERSEPKDDWFADRPHNPLDDMPIATNDRFDMYGSSDCDDAYNPPRPEEEIADNITMHEKMYRIATSRNNPFHVGASENLHADIDYVGGSENVQTNR